MLTVDDLHEGLCDVQFEGKLFSHYGTYVESSSNSNSYLLPGGLSRAL